MGPIGLISDIFNCIGQTKEQREFNAKIREYGLEIAINKSLEKIHKNIPSKEMAIKFVLQELDFANQENTLSQEFLSNSGFHPLEYKDTLNRFKESEKELLKPQSIFDELLRNLQNEEEVRTTSINIIEDIMSHWAVGKYALAREENEEQETEILQEKELKEEPNEQIDEIPIEIEESHTPTPEPIEEEKPVIEETKEPQPIYYDTQRVNRLMEEYNDIIGDIITGKPNKKEEKRIEEFKEHISKASIEGVSDHAIVLSCFYQHKDSYNQTLPIKTSEMNNNALKFLQNILKGFEQQGFSDAFLVYEKENREDIY